MPKNKQIRLLSVLLLLNICFLTACSVVTPPETTQPTSSPEPSETTQRPQPHSAQAYVDYFLYESQKWYYAQQETPEALIQDIFERKSQESARCDYQVLMMRRGSDDYGRRTIGYWEPFFREEGIPVTREFITAEFIKENYRVYYVTYRPALADGQLEDLRYGVTLELARNTKTGLWRLVGILDHSSWTENGAKDPLENLVFTGGKFPEYDLAATPVDTVRQLLDSYSEIPDIRLCHVILVKADGALTAEARKQLQESGELTEEMANYPFQTVRAVYSLAYTDLAPYRYEDPVQQQQIFHLLQNPKTGLWSVLKQEAATVSTEVIMPQTYLHLYTPMDTREATAENYLLNLARKEGAVACWDLQITCNEDNRVDATYRLQYDESVQYQYGTGGKYRTMLFMVREEKTGLWYIRDIMHYKMDE